MTGFIQDRSSRLKILKSIRQVLIWVWDQCLLIATLILAWFAFKQWKATNDTLIQIVKQTPSVIQSGKAAEDAVKIAAAQAKSSDESTQITLGLMKDQADAAKSLALTTKQSSQTSAKQMNQQLEAARLLAESTRAAAETSAKQLFMSQRPRIRLIKADPPSIAVNHYGLHVGLQILVTNEGQSPAQKSWLNGSVQFSDPNGRHFTTKGLADTCAAPTGMDSRAGIAVPHGDSKEFQKMVFVPLLQVVAELKRVVPDKDGVRALTGYLNSCLLYESDLSNQPLNTGTAYLLRLSFTPSDFSRISAFDSTTSDGDFVFLPPARVLADPLPVVNGFEN